MNFRSLEDFHGTTGENGAAYLRQLRGLGDSFQSMQIVVKLVRSSVRDQCWICGGIYTWLWHAVESPTVSAAILAAVQRSPAIVLLCSLCDAQVFVLHE